MNDLLPQGLLRRSGVVLRRMASRKETSHSTCCSRPWGPNGFPRPEHRGPDAFRRQRGTSSGETSIFTKGRRGFILNRWTSARTSGSSEATPCAFGRFSNGVGCSASISYRDIPATIFSPSSTGRPSPFKGTPSPSRSGGFLWRWLNAWGTGPSPSRAASRAGSVSGTGQTGLSAAPVAEAMKDFIPPEHLCQLSFVARALRAILENTPPSAEGPLWKDGCRRLRTLFSICDDLVAIEEGGRS